ncbi:MAG: hypothetical protein ACI9OJ_002340 [Myxococcota bacterium]
MNQEPPPGEIIMRQFIIATFVSLTATVVTAQAATESASAAIFTDAAIIASDATTCETMFDHGVDCQELNFEATLMEPGFTQHTDAAAVADTSVVEIREALIIVAR